MPAYDAAAFANIKSDAWQLILPYGTSQEQVDAFAAYMAPSAPKAVVKASIIAPYSFPKLDAEAGAPYIGNWTAVAVTDGTDFYGMDLLGMSMNVVLNDDGTGTVDMDGDTAPGGWYVEDGTAIFAPILEEGGQPVPEEAMPFTLDENGRMCLDLGGLIMLMEKEGAEYATPAIPEKPWPELDADKAQYYVGTWDALSYIVDGETYPAELVGPTTLILNADGTALMTEGEEESYELYWYAESYSAYVGPAMSALAEIYFDMNGNLEMLQDGSKIIFAPHVDATPVPTAEPTPVPTPEPVVNPTEGGEHLLGDWYDDLGNKLTLAADGSMTYDEELGLTINTIKAYRYAEEYKLVSSEQLLYKYKWVSRGSKGIVGEASLGGFALDEKTLSGLPADSEYDDFDAAELSANGYVMGRGKTAEGALTDRWWVIVGGKYYYDAFEYSGNLDIPHITREMDQEIANERAGAHAYAYKVYTGAGDQEVTIAGIQQGNRLVADDAIGPMVRTGIQTKDQLLSSNKGGIIGGAAVFMALGAVLVFLGIRIQKTKEK